MHFSDSVECCMVMCRALDGRAHGERKDAIIWGIIRDAPDLNTFVGLADYAVFMCRTTNGNA